MLSRKNIIIADRDRHFANALRIQLDALGLSGCIVPGAVDALMLAVDDTPPMLLLLDAELPGFAAYEVCAKLRAGAACRDTPVVLMSGSDSPNRHLAAARAGASALLVKPFSLSFLLRHVGPLIMARNDPGEVAAWHDAVASSTAIPIGAAEPQRLLWTPPKQRQAGTDKASAAAQGLHMLTVMRRREGDRGP